LKNPLHPTSKQRLAEALRERDEASMTAIALIRELEDLMERFKKCLLHSKSVATEEMAEIAVSKYRAAIRKAQRGT
jgi:hypothetical protein